MSRQFRLLGWTASRRGGITRSGHDESRALKSLGRVLRYIGRAADEDPDESGQAVRAPPARPWLLISQNGSRGA